MKVLRTLTLALTFVACAFCQASLMPMPVLQFSDLYGNPLAGGFIYTCVTGSSCPGTPLAAYTDSTAAVPLPNPIVLNAAGEQTNQIWLGAGIYKIVVTDLNNVVQSTTDPVVGLQWINATKCAANGLACLDGNAFVLQSELNYNFGATGAVNRTVQHRLQDRESVKDFGATGNGTTTDTTAILAAIAAAKLVGGAVYFPTGTYLTNLTLDVTGLRVFGDGRFNSIIKMTSGLQIDVLQTSGNSTISDLEIQGSWNGSTPGLTGNGISTLSSPGSSPPYYGYGNVFENLYVVQNNKYGIYINDGAYESLHNVEVQASGLDGLYLDSGNYSGFQTTTVTVDGQSIFSSTPFGYGVVINNGIDISFTGTTTIENTKGIELLGGAGRNITLDNIYQEGNSGPWLTAIASGGIGLVVRNCYGPGTTSVPFAQIAGWVNYSFANNDFGPQPGFTSPAWTAITTDANVDNSDIVRGPFTFVTGTPTVLSSASLTPGVPWHAVFVGSWTSGYTQTQTAPVIEVSQTNPTITNGALPSGTVVTISLSSAGYLQGTLTNSGNLSLNGTEFMGSIFIVSGRNVNNASIALQTSDTIGVGGVAVGGGSLVNAVNYFSTASVSPGGVAGQTCADSSYTVTGAAAGDLIGQIKPPGALGNLALSGYVSGTNLLLLHFCNPTGGSVTPPAGVYSFVDFR